MTISNLKDYEMLTRDIFFLQIHRANTKFAPDVDPTKFSWRLSGMAGGDIRALIRDAQSLAVRS
jgi:ATP-dependent 26S proteasome regulatory subunit